MRSICALMFSDNPLGVSTPCGQGRRTVKLFAKRQKFGAMAMLEQALLSGAFCRRIGSRARPRAVESGQRGHGHDGAPATRRHTLKRRPRRQKSTRQIDISRIFRNMRIIARAAEAAGSATLATSMASRTQRASSASSTEILTTKALRCGWMTTRRSSASLMKVLRTGCRFVENCRAISAAGEAWPGESLLWRSRHCADDDKAAYRSKANHFMCFADFSMRWRKRARTP